jgi:hypothetical protein
MLTISSCQTDNNSSVSQDGIDNQLAYIQRFPRDTLKNYQIFKKSIISTMELKNEELTYKLILHALRKYPAIIQDKDLQQFIIYFYNTILQQEDTAFWIENISHGTWSDENKIEYFEYYIRKIRRLYPRGGSLDACEQLVNMARIHSLLFPLDEKSPLLLWKSYEIMKWIGSESEAKNLLDLIIIRHKTWGRLKEVKKERELIILEKNKNNQVPVS